MPIKKQPTSDGSNKDPKKQTIKKIESKTKRVSSKTKDVEIKDSKVIKKITSTPPKPKKTVIKKTVDETIDITKTSDQEGAQVPIIERMGFSKTKKMKEDKYVRLASDAPQEKFQEMGKKVMDGLVEWSFFAIDGDKGYHYYLVLENIKK